MKVPKTIWLLALVQLTLSLNSPLEAINPFEAIRSLSSSSQTSLADDVAKNDHLTHGQDVEHDFRLRQVFRHGLENDAQSLKVLSAPSNSFLTFDTGRTNPISSLRIKSHLVPIQIPQNETSSLHSSSSSESWSTTMIPAPKVHDKSTLINLAAMCSDAYISAPEQPDWLNLTKGFNQSVSFGWKHDGLRGHVFADQSNSTVILAFKGTTVDPRDRSATNDRVNDNLLFSCCCAAQRPDPYWYGAVCNCSASTYTCNATCLSFETARQDRYYAAALQVYANITSLYPDAQRIYTVGHSMGGSMASLLGLTYHIPSVGIEAVPQRLPAQRLGLSIPPDPHFSASWHFGHTADPVYMGSCNGYSSSCALAGYAFESQCFTGLRCVYDTVGDKGWRININTHRINNVIPWVLEAYDDVPECEGDGECDECFNWKFIDNDRERSAITALTKYR